MPTVTPASVKRHASPTRGQKKKDRTRQQLLDAALVVLAVRGEGFAIAELTEQAGVSHGTFYNYFESREELLEVLVPHLVEQFAARMADEVVEPDPAARFARISARALELAQAEPQLLGVALRIDEVQRGLLIDGPLAHLRQDLSEGFDRGRFSSPPDDGTLDVVFGALLLAARRIAGGERSRPYRCSVLQRLLQALGIAELEAEQLARDAVDGR